MTETQARPDIPLTRVQVLSDVIFASSMTIMVLTIDLPDPSAFSSDDDVERFLVEQLPRFGRYAMTFILIAVYWFKNLEHFSYYRKTNQTQLWLIVFYLMFLVAIPFTNDFASSIPDYPAVQILYSANMLGLGMFAFFTWTYSTREHRLVDPDLSPSLIRAVRAEALTEPIIAAVSIAAAFIHPTLWGLSFLAVPVFFMLRKKFRKLFAK